MNKPNENKFYSALSDLFVGAKIEGESGYVNLMRIKSTYYQKVLKQFRKEIDDDPILRGDFREEFFDKLYNFFHKYFSKSGCVYFVKTYAYDRIYEKVYSDSKDVSLFWKTHMLYYVKSDILFKSIDVQVEDEVGNTFHFFFDVGELEVKQNNEKRELVFSFKEVRKEKDDDGNEKPTIILSVAYSERGKKTKKDEILKAIQKEKVKFVTEEVLDKAIRVFKKQSEVDFFINKNAKAFLEEQLDLYLHQLLLKDENKFTQKRLDQIKTIKTYAKKIISFISQFEDELVKIWNKPKFVLNSNYVIILDKLSPEIIEKIAKHKGLKEQIKEWQELNIVDENFKFQDIFENNLLGKGIKAKYQYLPIDTKYFKDLELEILDLFDNLDEVLDGRLIHSENYQALNTLLPKYKGKVQCIYIDPPFNTGKDFAYVDRFQDSTWLTLMYDRIKLGREFLKDSGSFYLHLDDNANYFGRILIQELYENITEIIFDTNATKDEESDLFGYKSFGNDFVLKHQTIFFAKNDQCKFNKLWKPNRNKSNLKLGLLDLIAVANKEKPAQIKDFDYFVEQWRNGEFIRKRIDIIDEKIFPLGDIWNDIYSFTQSDMRISESLSFSSSQKPEHLLRRIIQASTNIDDIVFDFFAGSGTTIAAAHKLNRNFLGIELGKHFNEIYIDVDTFSHKTFEKLNKQAIVEILSKNKNQIKCVVKKLGLLGRMKWVLFGDKRLKLPDGRSRRPYLSKDINWNGGGFFKYYNLEQYENTLRKMRYRDYQGDLFAADKKVFEEYIFFGDEKLALSEVIEEKKGEVLQINFEKLYPNIDWPETLSNLLGKPIKRIKKGSVILQDGDEEQEIKFDFNKMSEREKIEFLGTIRDLIWWGE